MKRIQATVSGRVQGVSFRYYTQREAQRLGLTGWVCNQPDGTVLTVAEGDEPALLAFVRFLHQGPSAARVTDVTLAWQEAVGEFTDFTVRYFYQ
ncbi:MAG: acylphosphatase [Anaerolineae bacterium]|nr:acylphosphatase [Anaerolineae bacterium]